MSLVPPAIAVAASLVFEVALRRVDATVQPVGSISTETTRITPLGPRLQLAAGGRATWRMEGAPAQTLPLRSGNGEPGGRLTEAREAAPWLFEAQLASQPDARQRWRLQLRWQQAPTANAPGGEPAQSFSTDVWVVPNEWTPIARDAPGQEAPAKGSLSTQGLGKVAEWQVRVSPLPP